MTQTYIVTPDDVLYFYTIGEAREWLYGDKFFENMCEGYKDDIDYNGGDDIIIELFAVKDYDNPDPDAFVYPIESCTLKDLIERHGAVKKMANTWEDYCTDLIEGIKRNADYVAECIEKEDYMAGFTFGTTFIKEDADDLETALKSMHDEKMGKTVNKSKLQFTSFSDMVKRQRDKSINKYENTMDETRREVKTFVLEEIDGLLYHLSRLEAWASPDSEYGRAVFKLRDALEDFNREINNMPQFK